VAATIVIVVQIGVHNLYVQEREITIEDEQIRTKQWLKKD